MNVQELRDLFTLFDKDGDGELSAIELMSVMKALNQNPSEAEVYDMIDAVDKNQTGTVSLDEFLAFMNNDVTPNINEEDLASKLSAFCDDEGYITIENFKHVVSSLGDCVSEEDLNELFWEVNPGNYEQCHYTTLISVLMGRPIEQ